MMDFLHYIPPVIIYAVLLAIHYFLSRTGNKILGLIVPVGVIASLVYMYQADITDWRYDYRYCGSIILGRGMAESTKG
ncbi:membrane protein [Staphylococcus epidermidis]|nr:membrane protein [Staphylococcus epidermidis]